MEDKTMDERLDDAINEAFDKLHAVKNEDNYNAVKELVKLEIDKRRVDNDYYCRASEINNESQRIDNEMKKIEEDRQKELEDRKILVKLKDYVPEYIKTAMTAFAMLCMTIIIKRYEEKGYLIKISEIVKVVMNTLGFGK